MRSLRCSAQRFGWWLHFDVGGSTGQMLKHIEQDILLVWLGRCIGCAMWRIGYLQSCESKRRYFSDSEAENTFFDRRCCMQRGSDRSALTERHIGKMLVNAISHSTSPPIAKASRQTVEPWVNPDPRRLYKFRVKELVATSWSLNTQRGSAAVPINHWSGNAGTSES
jgi:hypothetical protein